MHKSLRYIAFAISGLLPLCPGQALFDGNHLDGAHLYEVSIFSGYSTSANPLAFGALTPPSGALNADVSYGASAAVGWEHHREKTNFSVRYSASYSGLIHYSNANGFSQWLNLGVSRKLASKWSVNLSASAQDATLVEVLNEPSALSVSSQLSADFNDFAAAFGLGNFSTSQAASMILGAPVVQAPLRALLLGNKILSYSGSTGLQYAYSPHLSFHASAFGSGGQNRSNSLDGIPATNYVLPHSLGAAAGVSWSSSLSPRTDVGVNLEGSRLHNGFQDAYTATATASVGRKMSPHWFARVYGGGTYTDVTQQQSGSPVSRQAVGGASLGYKTYQNTLVGSYDRSASDAYGSVIGTYQTASASWTWRRPGSRLSTFASYGKQQVTNTGFESFSGWEASAGGSEQLSANTGMSAQYVYFKTGGNYQGSPSSFSVQSIRVTLSWSPETIRR
jgi:hypothetical protein